jgi:integrase
LELAEIDKRDKRDCRIDVHALRHSFGTMLSTSGSGVWLRVAPAVMRHSNLALTMNVYTDPKFLDVHAALD